jgi:hypothetical protein
VIISHKHKFIFIQNRKVAGSSVKAYLARHCGPADIVTPTIDNRQGQNITGLWNPLPDILYGIKFRRVFLNLATRRKFYGHMPASMVRSRAPRSVWDNYFKFCIERNPWDKTLSHYYMKSSRPDRQITLDKYLKQWTLCSDYNRYTDRDGSLLVDRVIRYERLTEELGEVLAKLGIPFEGSLGVNVNAQFRSDSRDYREQFSAEQKAIVERAFANEIRLLGYRF